MYLLSSAGGVRLPRARRVCVADYATTSAHRGLHTTVVYALWLRACADGGECHGSSIVTKQCGMGGQLSCGIETVLRPP
jgi:hypothetical protein